MLLDFIWRHELDIVFLQEVTNLAILNITQYSTHLNIEATAGDGHINETRLSSLQRRLTTVGMA